MTGADTKRIRELRHDEIRTYGRGKGRDKKYWRSVVDELLAQGALLHVGDPYPVLNIPDKGSAILFGRESLMALRKENLKTKASQDRGEVEGYDNALFERLRTVRKRMAEGQQVPPYIIFSDKTLHEMCRRFPLTLSDMRKISGVGDSKLERYGKDFIREIGRYLDEKPAISVPAGETGDSGCAGHKKRGKRVKPSK